MILSSSEYGSKLDSQSSALLVSLVHIRYALSLPTAAASSSGSVVPWTTPPELQRFDIAACIIDDGPVPLPPTPARVRALIAGIAFSMLVERSAEGENPRRSPVPKPAEEAIELSASMHKLLSAFSLEEDAWKPSPLKPFKVPNSKGVLAAVADLVAGCRAGRGGGARLFVP